VVEEVTENVSVMIEKILILQREEVERDLTLVDHTAQIEEERDVQEVEREATPLEEDALMEVYQIDQRIQEEKMTEKLERTQETLKIQEAAEM